MAAIRLQFPGKEHESVIALTGKHITIGRAATNALQILNRTISLHHAALIEEDGHYRVLDLGSRNGLFVNGDRVSDFSLRERCSLTFGTFECEYLPELPQDLNASIESLPTQAEVHRLEKENAELKVELRALRDGDENGTSIRQTQACPNNAAGSDGERRRIQGEIEALKARVRQHEWDAVELRAEIAALESDRRDLQCSLDAQQVAFEALPKRADLEKLQEENARLKQTAAKKIDDLNLLRATVVSDAAVIQELRTQLKHTRALLLNAEKEISQLDVERSALTSEFDAFKSASAQDKGAFERRKAAEISDLTANVSTLSTSIEALKADNETLKTQLTEATSKLSAFSTQPNAADLEKAREESAIHRAELDTRVTALTNENEVLKAQLTEATSKLSAAQSDADRASETAHIECNAQLERHAAELERLVHENATLRDQLGESKRRVAALDKQIAKLSVRDSSTRLPKPQPDDPNSSGKDQSVRRRKRGSNGEQLEDALGRLGYVVRPVRRALIPPPNSGAETEPESGESQTCSPSRESGTDENL